MTHYQKQIGNRVKVRMYVPIHNRRNFVGVLLRVDEKCIHLLVEAEEMVLPFSDIEKANVVADIR
jgi:ribosome maturation factor RimP